MTCYKLSATIRAFFFTVCLLTACSTASLHSPKTELSSTSSPSTTFTPLYPASTVQLSVTPTARTFENEISCGESSDLGHLFFLAQNMTGKRNRPSNYDLLVMNGNGCFPRLIQQQASGSPALSKDWKKLAIGCENNTLVCILNIQATLDTCTDGSSLSDGKCRPVILQKFALPPEIAGQNELSNISWSSDGSQLMLTGRKSLHLLTLVGEGTWETLFDKEWGIDADWSPNEAVLALSEGYLMDLSTGEQTPIPYISSHQWSPNGKRIAFVKASEDSSKEFSGIAAITLEDNDWQWLYEPLPLDRHYWPHQNLRISDSGAEHRLLSWSPDEQYIAFVSLYQHDYDSQIFRLDLTTGEIIVLTARLTLKEGGGYYFAPAWGPP